VCIYTTQHHMPKLNFACHMQFPSLTEGPRDATMAELKELLYMQHTQIAILKETLTQLQSRELCLHCTRAKAGWLRFWAW
jgi:hypothetical protein